MAESHDQLMQHPWFDAIAGHGWAKETRLCVAQAHSICDLSAVIQRSDRNLCMCTRCHAHKTQQQQPFSTARPCATGEPGSDIPHLVTVRDDSYSVMLPVSVYWLPSKHRLLRQSSAILMSGRDCCAS